MKLRLILKSSATRSKKSRAFEVNLPVIVGRGEQANFRIPHVRVSRKHCEISEEKGKVFIRDLGSTNGTMLRGTMLPSKKKFRVESGNVLTIGGLVFRVEFKPPAAAGAAVAGAIDFLEAESDDELAEPLVEVDGDEELELEAEPLLDAETAAVLPTGTPAASEPSIKSGNDLLEEAGAFLDEDNELAELEELTDDDAKDAGSSDDDLEAFLNDS